MLLGNSPSIADASLDAIITANSTGKILYWNKAAVAIYGYTAQEILGKPIGLLRPKKSVLPIGKTGINSLEPVNHAILGTRWKE